MKIQYRPMKWFDDCANMHTTSTMTEEFFMRHPMTTMSLDEVDWRFRSDWRSRYQSFCGRLKAALERQR